MVFRVLLFVKKNYKRTKMHLLATVLRILYYFHHGPAMCLHTLRLDQV